MNQRVINTVNRKADSGELRHALASLPANEAETLVRSAVGHRKLVSRWIATDIVKAALEKAGWPQDEIEFALYREIT